MANALLRGARPLLVQVCGEFAGTLWACAAALRATEFPRHADIDEPPTAEDGQPDVDGGATAGDPEPDEVRDELNAQAKGYSRCVEAVAALAYSTTVSYAERGIGAVPGPQAVVDALRIWLDPQRIGHFPRTLIERLLAADHLEMWSILARECDWGVPLLWLAQRVVYLPASEADSERAVGQMRRALGDYAAPVADDTPRAAFRWRCRRRSRGRMAEPGK
jgi:hypothetical protein